MSWVAATESETYLANTPGADDWPLLGSSTQTKYITHAYRILTADPDYSFPSTATQAMKDAQCEFAWSLYKYAGDERRQNVRAQGVNSMKVDGFSENYNGIEGDRFQYRYPAIVTQLLSTYRNRSTTSTNITRALNETV